MFGAGLLIKLWDWLIGQRDSESKRRGEDADRLFKRLERAETRNDALEAENSLATRELAKAQANNDRMLIRIEQLTESNLELKTQVETLTAENVALRLEVKGLRDELADVRRMLAGQTGGG